MSLIKAIVNFVNSMSVKVVEKLARRDGHNFARFGNARDFRTSAFYTNTYADLTFVEAYDKAFQEGIPGGKAAKQETAAAWNRVTQRAADNRAYLAQLD